MEFDDELQTILSEQRRELTVAEEMESDLDFAFQLQMQEAMNASFALHPSPSSSSPPHFHPLDGDVSNSTVSRLLGEEIARFEQECRDRELVEAEMKRMRETIDQYVHDQAFARDMLRIPEEEWERTGEHFHRPLGEGSSSSSAGGESFRVYFQGLVNEELVGDVRKMLAGIGVAICDARDNLIFKLKKPLVGGEFSDETLQFRALIEGLNTAVMLGLKRVTVICDDNLLYQHVTGKGIPKQGEVATLVDQVTLLQRKFSHCSPSLVAQNNITFAFKLARDAIVSQISQPAEIFGGKNVKETCAICLEDIDIGHMFLVDGCMHHYCLSCMKQHAHVKLLQGMLPKCPHEGCNSELKIESCKKFLTPELLIIMNQHMKEASIPAAHKIYCPHPRCSALMSIIEVLGSVRNANVGVERSGAAKCTECHGLFCINCKVPWHINMTCLNYKRLNPYPCAEDAKLKSLATRNLWRQCVKCNHMVELAEGCYHIYCRCGHEFCYTCGAEWKNKKATCACPIWDERNIIYDQNNGHQQRRA
ncbi:unnamed protein product [Ilex paraguariensis]|uniref:RBR-type E3 ubiquitin transferase n=1 Tax=Ilex paraguariensis TaxID=185542 RepID=A0ABC8UE11_9AQUA